MTKTTDFAAIAAAVLLTLVTFQQTVVVPANAAPLVNVQLA